MKINDYSIFSIEVAGLKTESEVKVKSLSRAQLFATPWTVAYQDPPSMGFSRQEDWSGCHRLLQSHASMTLLLSLLSAS